METNKILLLIGLITAARVFFFLVIEVLCHTRWAKNHLVYPSPPRPLQHYREEIIFYSVGLLFDACILFVLIATSTFEFHETKLVTIPIILLSFALLVEPLYYILHRLLHTRFLYSYFHIHHHRTRIPTPLAGYYFSVTERVYFLPLFGIPLIVLAYLDLLSLPILFIYMIVLDTVDTLGHINIKIFSEKYKKSFWHLLLYSPDFHADHHKYFHINYSAFMPIWDKLFGTYRAKDTA